MFKAPTPYLSTFSATVPASGFRATMIGSHAGFSAVPQPDQRRAASVAGAVTSIFAERKPVGAPKPPPRLSSARFHALPFGS